MEEVKNVGKQDEVNEEGKFRHFALMTYISLDEILEYVKRDNVGKYAYIYHDKEESEPHYHLIVSYTNPRTWQGVKNDFKNYTQNTFVEVVRSLNGVLDYLVHKNEPKKYQYDESAVVNFGYYRGTARRTKSNDSIKSDNAINIVEDILDGLTKRELLHKYGREYVINRRHYESLALDIHNEETCYVYNEDTPIKTTETKCRAVLLTEEGDIDFNPFNDENNKKERYIQNEVLCN